MCHVSSHHSCFERIYYYVINKLFFTFAFCTNERICNWQHAKYNARPCCATCFSNNFIRSNKYNASTGIVFFNTVFASGEYSPIVFELTVIAFQIFHKKQRVNINIQNRCQTREHVSYTSIPHQAPLETVWPPHQTFSAAAGIIHSVRAVSKNIMPPNTVTGCMLSYWAMFWNKSVSEKRKHDYDALTSTYVRN
jgi:hypothetical protein